jgi:hypothetical protein
MNQPIDKGAGRYIDVLHGNDGLDQNGGTYTSRPTKMTGPLVLSAPPHLTDTERQDTAMAVLDKLTQQYSQTG